MTDEEKVEVIWTFYCFRRHIATETLGVIQFIQQHPELGLAFNKLVSTAGAGVCAAKCMACGKNIFGDQALGGMVVLESAKFAEGYWIQVMSPVCTTCAKGEIDILESRALEYFSKTFADGEVKIGPSDEEMAGEGGMK